MKSKTKRYCSILLVFLIIIVFVVSFYFKSFYSLSHFEEILYSIKDGDNNADTTFLVIGFKTCLPYCLFLFVLSYLILFKKTKRKMINKIQSKRKIIIIASSFIATFTMFWSISFFKYIYYVVQESDFIKNNYVDSRNVDVKFSNKRNLIVISVESLETSLFKKDQGGYWDYEVIPELYDLLSDEDSVVFYNNNLAEQQNMIQGSSWTTASIIASTSAIPFKVNINNFTSSTILDNVYSLGDLLKDNGYYNEVISAANTSYGDLKKYFVDHSIDTVIDNDSLSLYDFKMDLNDEGRWGFNDNYLFKIAKERLTKIASSEEPFFLHLITIDTHFIDGFVGDYSTNKYDDQYENAYATESKLLGEFISWLKEQPYYKNTTIVIMGDHLSMQSEFFRKRNVKDRYVYSCIINPQTKEANSTNRVYTALDMYPTIVSAIGGYISNEKLGLGVNLFSNQMTLAEKYGINILDNELKKDSVFYKNTINSK